MNFEAFGKHVLVKHVAKAKKPDSGIIIPDTVNSLYWDEGIVMAAGKDSQAQVGSRVIFHRIGQSEIEVCGEKVQIIDSDRIVGAFRDDWTPDYERGA